GTGAFALVLTLMTFISLMFPTFLGQFSGGVDEYDISVVAPTIVGLSLPDSVRPQISREISMASRPYRGEVRLTRSGTIEKDAYRPLYALSSTQLAATPFELAVRES